MSAQFSEVPGRCRSKAGPGRHQRMTPWCPGSLHQTVVQLRQAKAANVFHLSDQDAFSLVVPLRCDDLAPVGVIFRPCLCDVELTLLKNRGSSTRYCAVLSASVPPGRRPPYRPPGHTQTFGLRLHPPFTRFWLSATLIRRCFRRGAFRSFCTPGLVCHPSGTSGPSQ